MRKTPSNDGEHGVTTLKKGVVGLQKTVRAFKTPIDPSKFMLYAWCYTLCCPPGKCLSLTPGVY